MRRLLVSTAAALLAAGISVPALAADQQDQAKAERIATILRDSGRMQDYSVGVKYTEGTAWLSGRVANEQQMQAALEVISDVPGVRKIVNDLSLSPGAASMRQPMAQKTGRQPAHARRVSANGADWDAWGAEQPMMAPQRQAPMPQRAVPMQHAAPMREDGPVVPAGFHRLAARKAARHACPPTMYAGGAASGNPPAYDQPYMPNYAWPSYAAYPNYSALTYPQQYSPTAWPYIGPFYPYPQVPLGWRKVALEWDDGWWFLDFYDRSHH